MSQPVLTGAAVAPIVLVLVLLVFRVPSLRAGTAGLIAAAMVAATVFKPDDDDVTTAIEQLGPTVVEVALILLGGVVLSTAMSASRAGDHIAGWLEETGSGPDRTPALLLLIFGLTPFMESVTGFGLGVVISAPLLVRMGLTPVQAVVSGLLGLVLVPWGSLGPGTLVAGELGGQDLTGLGLWSALLSLPVLVVGMATVVAVLALPVTAGLVALCATVVATQWVALFAANALLGVPPAGIVSAAAVIALLLGLRRLRRGLLPPVSRDLGRATIPFVVLLSGIFGTTAAHAAIDTPAALGWTSSPALWLIVAALVAVRVFTGGDHLALRVIATGLRTWVSVAANAIVFMLFGIVMATAGMAAHIAGLATGLGTVSLALAPAVGALGGYLTGSNTGAAAMFSGATVGAATELGADALVALAGQNVGGSYAIIVSPPRVALAVGVVMGGRSELPGSATRTLATAVVTATAALGIVVYLLAM